MLDQVNSRIQVFHNGRPERSFPIPSETYNDIALSDSGRLAVMDRQLNDEVLILDENGHQLDRVKLSGQEIPEGGLVTALFSKSDGIWVEVNNEKLVQLTDEKGRALDSRRVLPGRPSRDGRFLLNAALDGRTAAVVLARPAGKSNTMPSLLARVEFPIPVLQITALDSDRYGRVYLAATVAKFNEVEPYEALEEYEPVVVLSPEGQELGRVVFPPRPLPEEVFRPIWVTPEGVIYQMAFEESGVVFRRGML